MNLAGESHTACSHRKCFSCVSELSITVCDRRDRLLCESRIKASGVADRTFSLIPKNKTKKQNRNRKKSQKRALLKEDSVCSVSLTG